jgi:hypothetical protein
MSTLSITSIFKLFQTQKNNNPIRTNKNRSPIIITPMKTGDIDCLGIIPHFGHFSVSITNFSEQLGIVQK